MQNQPRGRVGKLATLVNKFIKVNHQQQGEQSTASIQHVYEIIDA